MATSRFTPTTRSTVKPLEEQVRTRAFELYEARGREDGHDIEDWLRAEAEITKAPGFAKAA